MGRKKKVGSAGRFGARYGKKVRKIVAEIEKVQKQTHICPKCNMPYVKRVAAGIWECKKCGTKFAGLAYVPGETKKEE
ncbi:MAG: 50S ribosomal protein L37ae [Candidatus Aenigmatarchaeota archaeon]|nr:MAG: 50S ribosomal protein L37ae [Candidatus Aenigmarchaeota archaeon]